MEFWFCRGGGFLNKVHTDARNCFQSHSRTLVQKICLQRTKVLCRNHVFFLFWSRSFPSWRHEAHESNWKWTNSWFKMHLLRTCLSKAFCWMLLMSYNSGSKILAFCVEDTCSKAHTWILLRFVQPDNWNNNIFLHKRILKGRKMCLLQSLNFIGIYVWHQKRQRGHTHTMSVAMVAASTKIRALLRQFWTDAKQQEQPISVHAESATALPNLEFYRAQWFSFLPSLEF